MKLFCLLTLLCYGFFVHSQTNIPAGQLSPEDAAFNAAYPKRPVAKVGGKLLHLTAAELKKINISYTLVTPFSSFQVRKTATVGSDGSFTLQMEYALPYQQVWIGVGDYFYAALYANKDLYLELDMKKIMAAKEVSYNGPGVHWMGTDAPLNVYLNNYILYKRQEQLALSGKLGELTVDTSRTTAQKRQMTDSIFALYKNIQDSYTAANPSPYGWLLENERLSDYYSQLCIRYWGQNMDTELWEKIKQHKSYLLSNNGAFFYNYMAIYLMALPANRLSVNWKDVALLPGLDASEQLLIDSLRAGEKMQPALPYTEENMKAWSRQLQPRIQKIRLLRSLSNNIHTADSLFPPAKADFVKLRFNDSRDVNEQKLALEILLRSMHTPWCMAVAKNEYGRTEQKINEINKALAAESGSTTETPFGKPLLQTSFGASLFKVQGLKADIFLAKLGQSYPGKAIIIDLWATWCGPCLSAMPHSKELEQASADLPVVFVYLCTISGSTETKWKSKVAELKQPGQHFLIDQTLDAGLAKYFSFSGYPGYAFINKSGQYQPGSILRITDIKNREQLAALVGSDK